MDFALARALMVDGQLRPNAVTDRVVLGAMRSLPRERFVPEASAATAYLEDNLPLPGRRVLMRPMSFAKLAQLAAPRPHERALVVAAGTGYGAAVLAASGAAVTAVEEDDALLAIARPALTQYAPGVVLRPGKLADAAGETGPFDVVVIEGAVRRIAPAIAALLAPRGRLVAILAAEGRSPVGVLAEASTHGLRSRPEFDAAVPLIPGLLENEAFSFAL